MSERICVNCGNPAEGFASVWTAAEGERWYCHGDDDETPTCYERAGVHDGGAAPSHLLVTYIEEAT